MWADLVFKIGGFGKNLILLGERLDRQTAEIKEIREEIKSLSSTVLTLRLDIRRLEDELRFAGERQDHERQLAEERYENFMLKVALKLQTQQQRLGDGETTDPRKLIEEKKAQGTD